MLEWLHNLVDWMPAEGSSWAKEVDWINNFITYVALFCTVTITGVMLYLMVRYRRRSDNQKTAYITHNRWLEFTWTAVPTLVVLLVFYWGTSTYQEARTPPRDALDVNVEGYKWGWNFLYETGKKSSNELVVPVNQPVRLILKSRDVNHSFFIPAMRIKEDAIASDYHFLWFKAETIGEYPVFCAEYCGTLHSGMLATLRVVSREDYESYVKLEEQPGQATSPIELGQKLYAEKACIGCHSLDGSVVVGPSFKGIWGKEHELESGEKVTVDENYVRESILNSTAKMVKGFPPVMPPFAGQLSDEEVSALIAFIKDQSK